MSDFRVAWVKSLLQRGFRGSDEQFESLISKEKERIVYFCEHGVIASHLLFYQTGEAIQNEDGNMFLTAAHLPERHSPVNGNSQGAIAGIYFIKNEVGAIHNKADFDATASYLGAALDWGVVPGNSLLMLEGIIHDVYIPMTDNESVKHFGDHQKRLSQKASSVPNASVTSDDSSSNASASSPLPVVLRGIDDAEERLRSDFNLSMHKFVTGITGLIHQVVKDNVQIFVSPEIETAMRNCPKEEQLLSLASNKALQPHFDTMLEKWTQIVQNVIETEDTKPAADSPLAEIKLWREKHAALSSVYEQIQDPALVPVFGMMEFAFTNNLCCNTYPNFKTYATDLSQKFAEAKDNVKFLTTLERHFKNLASGKLSLMLETIPVMMSSLRMVSIISRHYSEETRMENLMKLIAKEIANQVRLKINLKELFEPVGDQVFFRSLFC